MRDFSGLLRTDLCTRCIGRIFASVDTGLTNPERGRMILFVLRIDSKEPIQENSEKDCPICHGIFSEFDRYYSMVKSETGNLEFRTFLIGSRFPKQIMESEQRIQESFGSVGESIKKEFNREFGKYLSSITAKDADFETPDLNITIDTEYDSLEVRSRSIFVEGTYQKLRRDLPQTRWVYDSNMNESVESIIGEPLKEATGSKNYFLHAAGREDVDVRMLGNGREFVIEGYSPTVRTLDLEKLRASINDQNRGVIVSTLRFSDSAEVKRIKSETHYKTYRVSLECDAPVDKAKLEYIKKYLSGRVIYQRTPLRVMKRRSDLVRQRKIENVELLEVSGNRAVAEITAESGTYIKELVNGDRGRTDPSLSSLYGAELRVSELDVIQIHRSEN